MGRGILEWFKGFKRFLPWYSKKGEDRWAGSFDVDAGLDRILFGILRQAVADMRSLKDLRWLFRPDGTIDVDKLQKIPVERRGELLSAAGFVVGLAPLTGLSVPEGARRLSQSFLDAEDRAYRAELYAAALAGQPWSSRNLEGDQSDVQGCLRCGRRSHWRTVLVAPPGLPPEVTWRLGRPENHVPLCKQCSRTTGLETSPGR